jgi:hypothetical protein
MAEHGQLIAICESLIETLSSLRVKVSTSWLQDYDLLDWLVLQSQSFDSIVSLVRLGRYRDAYHTCRMTLESYLLLRTVWTCRLYRQRWLMKPKPGEDIADAQHRFIADVRRELGDELIDVEATSPKAKEVTLVRRMGPIVDANGKDSGRYLPFHWQAWNIYRSEHFVNRDKLRGKHFLLPDWAAAGRRVRAENPDARDRDLYKYLFTFDAMLNTLVLNKMLNKKTALRVVVHYNFLSGFSHTTKTGIDSLKDRSYSGAAPHYDHYHSELALLYVAHLAAMHLDVIRDYFKATEVGVASWWTDDLRVLHDEVERRFGYFWFVFNSPHEYDRFEHANRKSNWTTRQFVRPSEIRPAVCRYYDDPLSRLKRLHWSTSEFTSGNSYLSPFPRSDAWR